MASRKVRLTYYHTHHHGISSHERSCSCSLTCLNLKASRTDTCPSISINSSSGSLCVMSVMAEAKLKAERCPRVIAKSDGAPCRSVNPSAPCWIAWRSFRRPSAANLSGESPLARSLAAHNLARPQTDDLQITIEGRSKGTTLNTGGNQVLSNSERCK